MSDLLNSFVAIRLATLVGAEEERFWFAIVESHQTMLPVADMIAEPHVDNSVTKVEAVKVEPERIDDSIAFVHHHQDCRGIASATGTTIVDLLTIDSTIPIGPGFFLVVPVCLRDIPVTLQPWWTRLYIIIARQENVSGPPLVQFIQIGQRRMVPLGLNRSVI